MKKCCKCEEHIDSGHIICQECKNDIKTKGVWTSINDNIPPKNKQVLCWTKAEYFVLDMFDGVRFFNKHVTHWRPLPAPPKTKRGVR